MPFKLENYVSEIPFSYEPDSYGHFMKVDRVLFEGRSKYQSVKVINNKIFGNVLLLDGFFQVSELDEHLYHEPLVQPAMFSHPNPKNVLIVGGGDGGALEEVLKHGTVERVVMVELDSEVVEISKKHLKSVCKDAFSDRRIKLVIDDGRKFVENTKEKFDVIIVDLTDPFGPSKMLYTKEFYTAVSNALTKDGILALHSESPLLAPKAFKVIIKTLKSVFKHVNVHLGFVNTYATVWSFANASNSIDVRKLSPDNMKQKCRERGVKDLKYYAPELYPNAFEVTNQIKKMLEEGAKISTDKNPLDVDAKLSNTGAVA
ncbi:MAG: polyamine aminopropyltransferase [Candidatus Aenigmarchaeota archaeon]|nr:polyamine aminopropyltransferase [Candidatus Aenigmarchaeota archaeon]